jgi:hypothetical protein
MVSALFEKAVVRCLYEVIVVAVTDIGLAGKEGPDVLSAKIAPNTHKFNPQCGRRKSKHDASGFESCVPGRTHMIRADKSGALRQVVDPP